MADHRLRGDIDFVCLEGMMAAEGWAVMTARGEILVMTVSATRGAALVNWLISNCGLVISSTITEPQLEELWKANRTTEEIVPVTVGIRCNG